MVFACFQEIVRRLQGTMHRRDGRKPLAKSPTFSNRLRNLGYEVVRTWYSRLIRKGITAFKNKTNVQNRLGLVFN